MYLLINWMLFTIETCIPYLHLLFNRVHSFQHFGIISFAMLAFMVQEMKWSVGFQFTVIAVNVGFRVFVFGWHSVLLEHNIDATKVVGHICK